MPFVERVVCLIGILVRRKVENENENEITFSSEILCYHHYHHLALIIYIDQASIINIVAILGLLELDLGGRTKFWAYFR